MKFIKLSFLLLLPLEGAIYFTDRADRNKQPVGYDLAIAADTPTTLYAARASQQGWWAWADATHDADPANGDQGEYFNHPGLHHDLDMIFTSTHAGELEFNDPGYGTSFDFTLQEAITSPMTLSFAYNHVLGSAQYSINNGGFESADVLGTEQHGRTAFMFRQGFDNSFDYTATVQNFGDDQLQNFFSTPTAPTHSITEPTTGANFTGVAGNILASAVLPSGALTVDFNTSANAQENFMILDSNRASHVAAGDPTNPDFVTEGWSIVIDPNPNGGSANSFAIGTQFIFTFDGGRELTPPLNIPEPTSASLVGLGALLLLGKRRRG